MKKSKFSLLLLWGVVMCVLCTNVYADVPFEYETGASIRSIHTADGFVAAGSENKYVYLFDGQGNLKWKNPTDGPVRSVFISDGFVAAGSFIFDIGGHKTAEGDTGTVISGVTTEDSHIYLYDTSGSVKWRYKTRGGVSSVHISGGYVAGVTFKGHVYLFDTDGNLIWEFKNYEGFECANGFYSVHISKDRVIVGSDDVCNSDAGFVYFLDINNGELLREHKTGDVVWDVYAADNYVAAASQDNYVYLFDKDGTRKWKEKTGAGVYSVKIYKNYVAAGSFDGYAYLFDISGNKLWEHKEGNFLNEHVNSVDISDEGIIVGTWFFTYLLDFDGNLKWKWTNPSGGEAVVSMDENYIASGISSCIGSVGYVDIFETGKEYKKPISVTSLIVLGAAVLVLVSLGGVVYYFGNKGLKKKKKKRRI
ncbi:hypothetical protein BEH94_01245 [Candidatus Altiarchaeales archaeon WOR_SM1_SCG]|nr:hypothetical protein BEH94_01245 [Candidatus Altiarchaeales archaeon WOR_SM1_SCG]